MFFTRQVDGVWSQPGSQEQLQVVCYLQNILNDRAKIQTINCGLWKSRGIVVLVLLLVSSSNGHI
jgi:hypothetical protein